MTKPVRDGEHLAWIRTLPCAWCRAAPPSEASHHGPHGIATKASDHRAIPLCTGCHRAWHERGALGYMSPEQTQAWATERALDAVSLRLASVSGSKIRRLLAAVRAWRDAAMPGIGHARAILRAIDALDP